MQIIERFIEGKSKNELLCEDSLVVTENFIAVIDGVTGKSNRAFDGLSGGKAAAVKACECIEKLPFDIDCFSAVEKITEAVNSLYEADEPIGAAAAVAIVFSKEKKPF